MADRRGLILGGGLAGLTAAYTLQQAGDDGWLVLEKALRPGGHARTNHIDGYVFDYGPHILFTNDPEMEALIRDLLGENLRAQERQAFIYHRAHDLYTRFPFQAHLFGLPPWLVKECLVGLVEAVELRARGEFNPRNYEEWMRGFFGDGIADRLMIPYARKLWTVEPSTMDFGWIGRRVPTPEVDRILNGALTDDVQQVGATANFWYPWRGGIEGLASALAERVEAIELGCEVRAIDLDRRAVEIEGGEALAFDDLIFTLPLASLPRFIENLPSKIASACARLRFQGILNINIGVDRPTFRRTTGSTSTKTIFLPSSLVPGELQPSQRSAREELDRDRGRLCPRQAARHRARDRGHDRGSTVGEDPRRRRPHRARARRGDRAGVRHLRPRSRRRVETVVSWLRAQGISCAGRFGEWQYFNMDHAMKSGRLAAEAILAERRVPEEVEAADREASVTAPSRWGLGSGRGREVRASLNTEWCGRSVA